MYDVIVVGAGPAGLTAAVYTLRAGKSVLLIEKAAFGGQITFSPKVENFPSVKEISGNELAERMVDAAIDLGAEFESDRVVKIEDNGATKTVICEGGSFEAKAVIIAVGVTHRQLGLERENDFVGEGISFCAVCDGAFYEGKTVAVIGGGNSALQEAILLSDLAKKVYVIQNLDFFTGEQKLVEKLEAKDNVEIILGTVVEKLIGETELKGITIKNVATEESNDLTLDGMFVAIGLVPQNDIFKEIVTLDERGYVDANENCLTNAKGVFVAGDCRTKNIRQVITAAGDGAVAALAACDYVDSVQK